ncbi:MAG: helix-turn-helix domain-containing protein [Desulfurococcales archaeon]|nr:helix-turn-helix domain-containing protein [Desulfurococcales archaeon]MCE4629382.1 helix-turn-helix domain-containing protein [Desulfurococcales archaeon]
MTSELPQEYVAKSILPSLRGALSHCLSSRGLSQHQIARLLGVTQPMIYKYLRGDREDYMKELERLGINRSTLNLMLDIACEKIIKGDYRELSIIANTLALQSSYCMENYALCEATLCSEQPPILKIYYATLERLISLPIIDLIPEVGSNLAYSPKNAQSIDDVIGLDGRIVKATSKRVIVAGSPVYGGSKHVGRVALKYTRKWNVDTWAFVIKFNKKYIDKLYEIEGVATEIEMDENLEPVVYIVSRDPNLLVDTIKKLVDG